MFKTIASLLVVSMIGVTAAFSATARDREESAEKRVSFEQLPRAVKTAIHKATKRAKIGEIEKQSEDGKTVYEVEASRSGVAFELTFDEHGTLINFEIDDQEDAHADGDEEEDEEKEESDADKEQITSLDKIPTAARQALVKLAGKAKIEEVESESENGVKLYEAAWRVKGVEHEALVTAVGDLVETEETIAAGSAPKSVQRAAAKIFSKGTSVKIERKTVVLYEIEAEHQGREKEVLLDATGQRTEIDHEDHDSDDDDD